MTYSSSKPEEHYTSVVTRAVWVHVAVLIVIAMALTYPCIRRGLPTGHSTITHILYQHYFNEQIAQGDWSPKWIISMNRGLGGAVFFAQYPLPYYVAWGIGKIIPNHWGPFEETRTQGLALAFAAILAGLFAYAWCATFVDSLTAVLAAAIYLTLPYFLTIDLYLRAAIGEFWALSFLPLSFYFIERMAAGSRRAVPGLAVAFALVIVSHLFTAVLLAPILLAYAVWRVDRERRVLSAFQVLAAFLLATGLAGVYALPFLAQRRFFHPENFLLTQGANASPLSQMFSFNAHTFPGTWNSSGWSHLTLAARLIALAAAVFIGVVWFRSRREQSQWLRSIVALVSIAALLRAALAGRHVFPAGEVAGAMQLSPYLMEQRSELFVYTFLTFVAASVCYWSIRNSLRNKLANLLMVLALISYLMMTSWSEWVWKSVHFLWNIQFPWRLNSFLLAATTGLAALAISGLRRVPLQRGLASAVVALGIWGVVTVQSARMGNTFSAFRSTESYEFVDEMDSAREIYMQVDPRQALLVQPPGDEKVHVTVERGTGVAAVMSVLPRSIQLDARCETNCILQVGQFYYPAWRVRTVPTAQVAMYPGSPGGLMNLSLPAGEHRLVLEVPHSLSERLGAWLSLVCLLVLMVIAIKGTPFPRQLARRVS
ncbi:MAG TPA: hypothetical protein VMI10_00955 [Terriglobales bacterium]|nr:hypothetical protein [Terriglobales bacterium]